jgi:hypothetical protein
VDFAVKTMNLVDKKKCRLQLWDVSGFFFICFPSIIFLFSFYIILIYLLTFLWAGQERFGHMTKMFYKGKWKRKIREKTEISKARLTWMKRILTN